MSSVLETMDGTLPANTASAAKATSKRGREDTEEEPTITSEQANDVVRQEASCPVQSIGLLSWADTVIGTGDTTEGFEKEMRLGSRSCSGIREWKAHISAIKNQSTRVFEARCPSAASAADESRTTKSHRPICGIADGLAGKYGALSRPQSF